MIKSEILIDEINKTDKEISELNEILKNIKTIGHSSLNALTKLSKLIERQSFLRKQLQEICRKREAEYENR